MQQIGNVLDEKIMYKHIYGGHPREIILLNSKYNKVLNDGNINFLKFNVRHAVIQEEL